MAELANRKPLKVGVTRDELVPANKFQLDMFNTEKPADLDHALDSINNRFGRDTVYFGGANLSPRFTTEIDEIIKARSI